MKNLLFFTSLMLASLSMQSCQSGSGSSEKEQMDTTASSRDTLVINGDTIIADSIAVHGDTLMNKDEQYENSDTEKHEAPDHKTPDEEKLDSIKQAKSKKKKG